MRKKYFVTGSDTDVGKTIVSAAILCAGAKNNLSTLGMKPIAAGCMKTEDGLRNQDALLLKQFSTKDISYQQLNPVALEPAVAPHIAAAESGRRLTADQLVSYCRGVFMQSADLTIIEGAGGWYVPINPRETIADIAKQLSLPVILVVAVRLGCINHALLSARSIANDGLKLAGWVANVIDENGERVAENIEAIGDRIGAPLLAEILPMPSLSEEERIEQVSNLIKLESLIKD